MRGHRSPGVKDDKTRRLSALYPAVFLVTAFILQLISIISGMKPGQLQDFSLMTLNTSQLGQRVVQFSEKPASSANATTLKQRFTSSLKDSNARRLFNPLDPLGLLPTLSLPIPTLSLPTPTLNLPTLPGESSTETSRSGTPTSLSHPGNSSSPLPGPPGAIDTATFLFNIINNGTSFVDGIFINAFTAGIDLNAVEASLAAFATAALGIQQFYSLHLLTICTGNVTSNLDSVERFNPTVCIRYTDLLPSLVGIFNKIPSSFQVVSTNVSIPLIRELSHVTDKLSSIFQHLDRLSLAFHYIALIGTGSAGALSIAAIFLPNSLVIAHLAVIMSFFGATFQTGTAVIATIIIVYLTRKVDDFGKVLGVTAQHGNQLLIITWVAWVLAQFAALYWDVVWFVELRNEGLKRKLRTKAEKGNYSGICKEVRNDLRKPKSDTMDDMEEDLIEKTSRKLPDRRVEVRREEVKDAEPGTFRYVVSTVPHSEEPIMTGAVNRTPK